jgi:hypothetical protein
MKTIRVIRELTESGCRGPSRGMFALQSALRKYSLPWLQIGGGVQCGEVPWIWSHLDASIAVVFSVFGWPYIIGPNVLFNNSASPGEAKHEASLLDSEACALQFTESEWYRDLIAEHCNHNEAPIVLWSYPIDPQPEGPLPEQHDVLIYLKDRSQGRAALRIAAKYHRSNVVVYGHYNRDEMIDVARRSRCCVYLSSDDRGPLALAEIMLCGCPCVGIPRGSPWIQKESGVSVGNWCDAINAVEPAMQIKRDSVRDWAVQRFSTQRTVDTIVNALTPIANGT